MLRFKDIIQGTASLRQTEGYKYFRRGLVFLFGITILICGIAMIFLPGPAILIIPLSLVILGTEFVWARRLLRKFRQGGERIKNFTLKK